MQPIKSPLTNMSLRFLVLSLLCVVLPLWSKPDGQDFVTKSRALPFSESNDFLSNDGQFSKDGRVFAATSSSYPPPTKTFHSWDTQTTKQIGHWRLRHLVQFALSPNGQQVAVITGDRGRIGVNIPFAVELRDARRGNVKRPLIRAGMLDTVIYAIAWSPDSTLLATGSSDGLARIWDVRTGKRLATLQVHGYVGSLRFSPVKNQIAVVGDVNEHSQVQMWDYKRKKLIAKVEFNASKSSYGPVPSYYVNLSFPPIGRHLVAVNTYWGAAAIYDATNLKMLSQIIIPDWWFDSLTTNSSVVGVAPDGKTVTYAGSNQVWVQKGFSKHLTTLPNTTLRSPNKILALNYLQDGQLQWVTVSDQGRSGGVSPMAPEGAPAPRLWEAHY